MRFPIPFRLILFAAGACLCVRPARAVPINLVFNGDLGEHTVQVDLAAQPPQYQDISEYSGDYVNKQADFRINTADYYTANLDGLAGTGYDWYLERYPVADGIYEDYSEFDFYVSPTDYVTITGSRSQYWQPGFLFFGRFVSEAGGDQSGSMTLVSMDPVMDPVPMAPEPPLLGLFGLGLVVLAASTRFTAARPASMRR